jgi:serine/threonine-protein kinase
MSVPPARGDPAAVPVQEPLLSPAGAGVAVAAACCAGAVAVLALGRAPTAPAETAGALGVTAVLCLLLAASHRLPDTDRVHHCRAVVLFFTGLLAGVPGWFFGVFSAFAGVIALLVMAAGSVSGSPHLRWPALSSWTTYAGLALGQALAFYLPFAGIIGDRSLLPVFHHYREPHINQVFAHVAIQVIYLLALLGARALARKYRELAEEVDRSERVAAVRDALLEEARADYMRALLAGRRGASFAPSQNALLMANSPQESETRPDANVTRLASTGPSAPDDESWASTAVITAAAEPDAPLPPRGGASPTAPRPLGGPSDAELRWADAYRDKMRRQLVVLTAAAAFGCVVISVIGRRTSQIWFACGSMAAVVALAWYQHHLNRRQRTASIYWPWAVIGALSVGPSYAFGLHSAFAAVITTLLYLGGIFRARQHEQGKNRRILALCALCLAQFSVFALIRAGVLPEISNVLLAPPGATPHEPLLVHLLLQGVFVASFATGRLIDRRHDVLMRHAAAATHEHVKKEEMLQTTRAAIDRLRKEEGQGIFANHKIDRFELRRLCGRGGMGDVYEAIEDATQRKVAVKLIRYDRAADPLMLRLFVTEAAALARVRSPHVAEVLGAGGLEQDLPYVAMEFIDGLPLSRILRERGRLPMPELCALMRDSAFGLAAIHGAGIVHRDVKPENIMQSSIAGSWCWKIVDLGVAQAFEEGAGDPNSGLIVGTPQYMSPEQALGGAVDARSDLYSLCLVAYRALTGRPALIASSHSSAARSGRDRPLPAPQRFVPMPADLEYVLRIGLASTPNDRFASAEELAAAFDDASRGALSESLRRHARHLLQREPWGTARNRG